MWEVLEEIFKEIGLPYSRQGSYETESELPNSFFTFWNVATNSISFYNDYELKVDWEWAIYIYTNDPSILYSKLNEFIDLAKKKGFVCNGRGKDIASGIQNYFGRYVTITYSQIENK